MYSLIIAEDELTTRRGLVNMVKWNELGFRVDGAFSDGREVLDYLSDHIPDVILTDIQMSRVTGVDIARFVAEQNLPIQVVFLTAHKDFTFAQFAVEYHVAHYLLKPISIPKIRDVFQKLRGKLDKQSVVDDALQNRVDHYNRLVNYEKQQFVTDAYFGSLTGAEQIRNRLHLLDAGAQQGNLQQLYLVRIVLKNDDQYAHFTSNFGVQELQDQLIHIQESFDQRLEYYQINWHAEGDNDEISMLGVLWEKNGAQWLEGEELEPEQAKISLRDMIHGLTSIETEVVTFLALDSPEDLARCAERIGENEPVEELMQDMEYLHLLREQKKLLYSCICQKDMAQIEELSHAILSNFLRSGIAFAQRQCLHTITKLIDRIADNDLKAWNFLYMQCMTPHVFSTTKPEELENWFDSRIVMLFHFVCDQTAAKEDSSIEKVMNYVQDHCFEDITLTDIAEKVFLNPVYISRLIKEQTGKNYTDLVMELRIERAVYLLENTDMYVYEIAESVGYHNIKYFYKVFKKIRGCSPSDYRPAGKKGQS